MLIKNAVALLLALSILLLLCNCSQNSRNLETDDTEEMVGDTIPVVIEETFKWAAAKINFDEYCTSCHGHEVNAFVDRNWDHGNTKEDIVRSIKDGFIDDGMPAYDTTFTDLEIDELADYILVGIADRESYDNDNEETPKYYNTNLLRLKIDTVVSGLGIPWGLKVTADGTVYVTEKEGK